MAEAFDATLSDDDALSADACEVVAMMEMVEHELMSGDDERIRRVLAGPLLIALRGTVGRCA